MTQIFFIVVRIFKNYVKLLIELAVVQWFESNRLSVNLKKTNFIIFGYRAKIKEIKNCEILLDNMGISRTETAKFSGVVG